MNQSERDLLRRVKEAVFANPFSRERSAIDRAATGLAPETPSREVLATLIAEVTRTVNGVSARVEKTRRSLSSADRELLHFGVLFMVFHQFSEDFDVHIREQIKAGEACCPVPFAEEALTLLARHGLSEQLRIRFFSLFFQVRRAFYFINLIVGSSASVMHLRRSLWNNIFTSDISIYEAFLWNRMDDFSTLLLGETGTGKGMAAAAIGRSGYIPFNPGRKRFSESFTRAFVPINLSQFSEQLIESELFGHKKGAFTGAVDHHRGVFSRCSPCGAIFLDEIGDVGVPVQIKLLHVLQDRAFMPVGSHQAEEFPGRVIAATNRELGQLREKGQFRDDFYYRLCSDVIEVPPLRRRLREHPDELHELLHVTITRIIGSPSDELVARVESYIKRNQPPDYAWPGNIRELEQCVRRLLLNGAYQWYADAATASSGAGLATAFKTGALSAQELLINYCRHLYQILGTYEAVARKTRLDRRTVKKYISEADSGEKPQ